LQNVALDVAADLPVGVAPLVAQAELAGPQVLLPVCAVLIPEKQTVAASAGATFLRHRLAVPVYENLRPVPPATTVTFQVLDADLRLIFLCHFDSPFLFVLTLNWSTINIIYYLYNSVKRLTYILTILVLFLSGITGGFECVLRLDNARDLGIDKRVILAYTIVNYVERCRMKRILIIVALLAVALAACTTTTPTTTTEPPTVTPESPIVTPTPDTSPIATPVTVTLALTDTVATNRAESAGFEKPKSESMEETNPMDNFLQLLLDFCMTAALPTIVGACALDIGFGAGAALRNKKFDLRKLGNFYQTQVLALLVPYIISLAVIALVPGLVDFLPTAVAPGGLFIGIMAKLGGSALANAQALMNAGNGAK
jgi:hypothetical protein